MNRKSYNINFDISRIIISSRINVFVQCGYKFTCIFHIAILYSVIFETSCINLLNLYFTAVPLILSVIIKSQQLFLLNIYSDFFAARKFPHYYFKTDRFIYRLAGGYQLIVIVRVRLDTCFTESRGDRNGNRFAAVRGANLSGRCNR